MFNVFIVFASLLFHVLPILTAERLNPIQFSLWTVKICIQIKKPLQNHPKRYQIRWNRFESKATQFQKTVCSGHSCSFGWQWVVCAKAASSWNDIKVKVLQYMIHYRFGPSRTIKLHANRPQRTDGHASIYTHMQLYAHTKMQAPESWLIILDFPVFLSAWVWLVSVARVNQKWATAWAFECKAARSGGYVFASGKTSSKASNEKVLNIV